MVGLKSVEQLISKYGVSAFSADTPFIKRRQMKQQDAMTPGLPYCFHRILAALAPEETVWLFSVHLPDKKKKLATYLVDNHSRVVEQVYYQRDRKSISSCDKIRRLLSDSLKAANADSFELAA